MKQEIRERIEKIGKGEVPEGYRKTKVGIIPGDWEMKNLGFVAEIIMGQSPNGSSYNSNEIGFALINGPTEFTDRFPIKIQWTSEPTKFCQSGDILLCVRGSSTGRINIANDKYCIGRGVSAIRAKDNCMQSLIEHLTRNAIQSILSKTTGSTFPNIDGKSLRSILIPFIPTRAEQQKTAEILSTWDKAIELIEKLIEEKKEFKRGLMQKLLSGKVRFPEFTDDWKEYKLKDICKFMKGSGLSKEKLSINGEKKCILYGELYTTYSEVIQEVISKTNIVEGVPSQKGDVLIPASTTTSGIDLANATAIEENSVLLGGDINILRNNKSFFNSSFLAHYLTHIKKFDIASKAQGTTIVHLYGEHLKKIQVNIPQVKEQEKVAQVISIQNDEIEILTEKLFQLNEQKKGLMQLLLTGIVRVEVD